MLFNTTVVTPLASTVISTVAPDPEPVVVVAIEYPLLYPVPDDLKKAGNCPIPPAPKLGGGDAEKEHALRTYNIDNLSKIMSQGLKTQLDLASGQSELFTSELNSNVTRKVKKLNVDPPSNDELIRERKVLGYYLSSHPINKYKKELIEMKLKDILQVNNNIINNSLTKMTTTVSGIILDSRSQKIGKNKYINIFKVDDGSQCINISFFEEKYLKYKSIIREDTVLFFNGEVYIDDYDSQLSMRAESVFTLDIARERYSKYLKIVLSSDHVSKEKIHSIKKLITENNSGKTKVILLYKNRDVIVPVSSKQDIYVNISDKLLSEIRSIAGSENVKIKYQ